MVASDLFPADYFEARDAFRALSQRGESFSHTLQAKGPGGESLSLDAAYFGGDAVQRLVVLTSGVHGVEGYAGSALQKLWLREFSSHLPPDTGVLLVHAVNPHGFAHGRRVNENNVDLNRNALAAFPGPANLNYRLLNDWLNPASAPPRMDDFAWRLLPRLLRHGRAALTQAIAGGQYEFARGLFYGGTKREESLDVLWTWFSLPRFAKAHRVWHLDLHTGLGRYGRCQLLLDVPAPSVEHARWVRAFGEGIVKSDHAGEASNYHAHGIVTALTKHAFPQARVSTATLEFGTIGTLAILRRLRAENRLQHYGGVPPRRAAAIRRALVDAVAPADRAWRTTVINCGRELFSQLHAFVDDSN